VSGGDYETWVMGLRAWRSNPSTDLSHLPALTSASFTPATYERLMTHIQDALSHMMQAWAARLRTEVSASTNEHDAARALVQLRPELARRLQLAKHPGLPEEIRTALWDAAVADIQTIQADLEKAVVAPSSAGGTTDRAGGERMLALVRQNPFTAILNPAFDVGPTRPPD
jgi:hypothetical protein